MNDRPRRALHRMIGAVALIAGAAMPVAAEAQPAGGPALQLPREYFEDRLDRQGDTIVFCVNEDAMMAEFERDLAREIGNALLLNVEIFDVNPRLPTRPYDYLLPLVPQELFLILVDDCNAMLGFVLSNTFEDWLTISRPYLDSRYVLAVRDDAYDSLTDIPVDQAIGTRGMNGGDIALTSYLQALPSDDRWRRFPYFDNRMLMEKLLDGSVAAALMWEPALYYATDGDPAAAGISIAETPFEPRITQLGIAMLAEDVFLRTMIDEAIAALTEDGVIDELLVRHNLVASPAQ